MLLGALLFSLVVPDIDILWGMAWHGGPTHSFFAAMIWGGIFAFVCRAIHPGSNLIRWGLIGCAACVSHILLDAVTYGRGVMLFWPLSDQRMGSPIPLFFGVRHSSPDNYVAHFITISTELLFAIALYFVARFIHRYRTAARPVTSREGALT